LREGIVLRCDQSCAPHLLLRLRPDGLALGALRAALSQRERGSR